MDRHGMSWIVMVVRSFSTIGPVQHRLFNAWSDRMDVVLVHVGCLSERSDVHSLPTAYCLVFVCLDLCSQCDRPVQLLELGNCRQSS
jgi:hypothetical protein